MEQSLKSSINKYIKSDFIIIILILLTSGNCGLLGEHTKTPEKVGNDKWLTISAGSTHTCGIKEDKTLWCWGLNEDFQCGAEKTYRNKLNEVKINGESKKWDFISSGIQYSCAISEDKFLWCWGNNVYGQIGNFEKTTVSGFIKRSLPVKITNNKWVYVASESYVTCAIKNDDTLWCWGLKSCGQIGEEVNTECCWGDKSCNEYYDIRVSEDYQSSELIIFPKQILQDKWKSVSLVMHTCGIKEDNTLWCWGDNTYGQLGNGTLAHSSYPIKVGEDTYKSVSIGAGYPYTCAIKSDDTLWCWGDNSNGELGDGTTEGKSVPVKISNDKWNLVSANNKFACGIKEDNSLWCWGNNELSRLGDGTKNRRLKPVKIGKGRWKSVSTGSFHSCGIKDNNSLWCWGMNEYWELN